MSFIAIWTFKLPFPAVVLGAMLTGALLARVAPGTLTRGGAHAAAQESVSTAAVMDDDTPTLGHAQFRLSRLALMLSVGAAR